jgi:hypothetical protein
VPRRRCPLSFRNQRNARNDAWPQRRFRVAAAERAAPLGHRGGGKQWIPAAAASLNAFENHLRFDQALDELIDRGLLLFDKGRVRYDLHPVVRQYAYNRLTDKAHVHARLTGYFAKLPAPDGDNIKSLDDLATVIEFYHHTVQAASVGGETRQRQSQQVP